MPDPSPASGSHILRQMRTVARLPWADQWLLLESLLLLQILPLWLRLSSVARVQRLMGAGLPTSASAAATSDEADRVQRVVRLVAAASRHTLGPQTCLHRSLALWWVLKRRGLDGRMQFGVRHTASGLDGHAWVEFDGVVINDAPDTRLDYRPIAWSPARPDR